MLILFFTACQDFAEPPPPIGGSLSVLTYNVHGLPSLVTGDNTNQRIATIGPLLNDFDVIGLQEVFNNTHHDTLVAKSTHATHLAFSDKKFGRPSSSGLSIFSGAKLVAHHHEHYEHCYGTLSNSSDCMAAKGFQIARLELSPTVTIDVLNTHMDAGSALKDQQARETQIEQMITTVTTWSANQPMILMGDLNLHPEVPTQQKSILRLMKALNLQDSCEQTGCTETKHIDRILYRSSPKLQLSVQQWKNEPAFFDTKGAPMSDHPALSARFSWQKTPEE